jgi:hypothetical protein
MTPHGRRPDAAGLGRRVWGHIRSRAGDMPEEFTPDTRDDVTGWLWEGPLATLIREAVPGIADTDLRRAREYLIACGMVVNVCANQRGAQPQWFIRARWHQGPGGHVHMVTTARPSQPAAPPVSQPIPGGQAEELAHQPAQDIMAALQALARQVSQLQAENDRLREDNDRLRDDNDRLSAEAERIRALVRQIGGAIARQASQLLAGTGD